MAEESWPPHRKHKFPACQLAVAQLFDLQDEEKVALITNVIDSTQKWGAPLLSFESSFSMVFSLLGKQNKGRNSLMTDSVLAVCGAHLFLR